MQPEALKYLYDIREASLDQDGQAGLLEHLDAVQFGGFGGEVRVADAAVRDSSHLAKAL